MAQDRGGMAWLGRLISLFLILGLIGIGLVVFVLKSGGDGAGVPPVPTAIPDVPVAEAWEGLVAAETAVPRLDGAVPYTATNDTYVVELSEYAGYAGLIAANGGLAPSESSVFYKDHGFKVQLTLSEEESWSKLNSGKLAASATTADVLAVYGKQFDVVVPAQIGFSRGADGIVVRSDIHRLNQLAGQIVVASQFTEAEFFVRYLAGEAGIPVKAMDGPDSPVDPAAINLLFAEDAFVAADVFLAHLDRIAGCVTWAPKTTETVAASNGRARILTTNKNLLVVADILVVNKGLAAAKPEVVAGLVHGLLEGNRMVREDPEAQLATVGAAFKWDAAKTRDELSKVHLSNLPENLAFFDGTIDMAGSFGGIYQSAIYAYGRELIPNPVGADRFADTRWLLDPALGKRYANQKVEIAPIRSSAQGAVEDNPLLSKDIRFFFEPNSAVLKADDAFNQQNLADIKRLLQVSPGSTVLLRGHVDNAQVEMFRKQGGEAFVREMALKAVQLSKDRAASVQDALVKTQKADPARLETVGLGWDEPAGTDSDKNRRVEVQWFTVE